MKSLTPLVLAAAAAAVTALYEILGRPRLVPAGAKRLFSSRMATGLSTALLVAFAAVGAGNAEDDAEISSQLAEINSNFAYAINHMERNMPDMAEKMAKESLDKLDEMFKKNPKARQVKFEYNGDAYPGQELYDQLKEFHKKAGVAAAPMKKERSGQFKPQLLEDVSIYKRAAEAMAKAEKVEKAKGKYYAYDADASYQVAAQEFGSVAQRFQDLFGNAPDLEKESVSDGKKSMTAKEMLESARQMRAKAEAAKQALQKPAYDQSEAIKADAAKLVGGDKAKTLLSQGWPSNMDDGSRPDDANALPSQTMIDTVKASTHWTYSDTSGCETTYYWSGNKLDRKEKSPECE